MYWTKLYGFSHAENFNKPWQNVNIFSGPLCVLFVHVCMCYIYMSVVELVLCVWEKRELFVTLRICWCRHISKLVFIVKMFSCVLLDIFIFKFTHIYRVFIILQTIRKSIDLLINVRLRRHHPVRAKLFCSPETC